MEKYIKSFMKRITSCNLETGDFPGPAVTISRQAGCSAQRIAIKLSKILTGYSYMSDTKTDAEWLWVDKNFFGDVVRKIEKEIRNEGYDDIEEAQKILKLVADSFSSETIGSVIDRRLIDTFKGVIFRTAVKGRVILVGRAAGILLKDLPNKLNVRLEAPTDWRINRVMQLKDMNRSAAVKYVTETDGRREDFIEQIIGRKPVNDDFDIIFNYATMQDDEIIDTIVNVLKYKKIISYYGDF